MIDSRDESHMKKKRILHFDDDPLIIRRIAQSLKFYDCDVTFVFEIDELFKELKNYQYDALIMDIMAPIPKPENEHMTFSHSEIQRMDDGVNTGIILTEKIWQLEGFRDIPVLFLSARYSNEIDQFRLNGHKCEYLRKPQLAKTIDEKLNELLNK